MAQTAQAEQPDAPPPAGYGEIGDLLRQARTQLRLSLDQASRMLHIRVRYLEAMEEGALEELPGLPYIRGYIQTYAAFLGLDKDEILRRFDAVGQSMQASSLYFPQVLSKEKAPTPRMIWIGMALALAAYVVWGIASSYSKRTFSVIDSHPSASLGGAVVSARLAQDVACLKPQDALYPPCIVVKEPEFKAPPLDKKLKSVLELPLLPLEIPREPKPSEEKRVAQPPSQADEDATTEETEED